MSDRATIHRFEVSPKPGTADPIGESVKREAAALGVNAETVTATHVYLIQGDLTPSDTTRIAAGLLADSVVEVATLGASPAPANGRTVEVHPLPGVMDPVAQSVEHSVTQLIGKPVTVASGWRYDLEGVTADQAGMLGRRLLSNPVIQRTFDAPYQPKDFPHGESHSHDVVSVTLTTLSDDQLTRLSREGHLFLSLEEMKAVQAQYKSLGREPTDIELETLAQTWSEHCVHKTLKSQVRYEHGGKDPLFAKPRKGVTNNPDGSVHIDNLLKSTVAAATFDLIADGIDWTLSVFKDNSGVIAFDDAHGICIKVETHNRPSAIEPYGGAATGAGGCIRDVIGTGLGARPIANTDVFCVAMPDYYQASAGSPGEVLPKGVLHPQRVLTQVVAGVRDYGNRMGIPTISGAVAFDNRYIGNPLVFCGCIGLIPRDKVHGQAHPGDRIIALGGRTGRDGVHGATFSSAGLENNAADEFAHAVQIGNAIEEKRVRDAILLARDGDSAGPLYHGMTDCGAGGFSSAIGEMGSTIGAAVDLERAPLKYAGLSYTEIWISEAQERMVLAVPAANVPKLQAICKQESVEMADLGEFGTPDAELILRHNGKQVGRMPMHFVHEGIPQPTREAAWTPGPPQAVVGRNRSKTLDRTHLKDALLALLSHPDIASKHWIIRQYDHEVRGATIVKPLVGPAPHHRGPSDASVIRPVANSSRGIAVSCGLQTATGDPSLGGDPYQAALAGIDECVRNLVCTGADPSRIAILDNFCWPSCIKPQNLAALVRACLGCYDGAMAYRTPFVSGKDSLNNQFTTDDGIVIEIPYTLLITGLAIVPDINKCVTTDAKRAGNVLVHIGHVPLGMGASHYQAEFGLESTLSPAVPAVDLTAGPATAKLIAGLIAKGIVQSAHDVSDGGALCAVAEMLIGGTTAREPLGADLHLGKLANNPLTAAFSQGHSRYILELSAGHAEQALLAARAAGIASATIGVVNSSGTLTDHRCNLSATVNDLAYAWQAPLNW